MRYAIAAACLIVFMGVIGLVSSLPDETALWRSCAKKCAPHEVASVRPSEGYGDEKLCICNMQRTVAMP